MSDDDVKLALLGFCYVPWYVMWFWRDGASCSAQTRHRCCRDRINLLKKERAVHVAGVRARQLPLGGRSFHLRIVRCAPVRVGDCLQGERAGPVLPGRFRVQVPVRLFVKKFIFRRISDNRPDDPITALWLTSARHIEMNAGPAHTVVLVVGIGSREGGSCPLWRVVHAFLNFAASTSFAQRLFAFQLASYNQLTLIGDCTSLLARQTPPRPHAANAGEKACGV